MPASVWKGFVSFGLVSFPVQLRAAARKEAVHFHMLHKRDLSRVKEVWYCAKEDKPISKDDIVKGFETEKGSYVVVEPEDLKRIAPPTARTMEILQFVERGAVDPIYFETSYYVIPDGTVGKPYSLFMAALDETGHDAIAKLAMHNREHVVLIRPSDEALVLHTLFYGDELHAVNKVKAPKSKFTAKELTLAKSLVEHLQAPFKAEQFSDTYRSNVERMIREKSKGKEITVAAEPQKAPVIDLMEALKKSLEASAKKPSAKTKKVAARHRRAA